MKSGNDFASHKYGEARVGLIGMLIALLFCATTLWAGTTGKIAGTVVDASTNEPLIGANIIVQGTYLGSVTDVDGFYTINNILPGKYTVAISFIGYKKYVVTNVVVKIDLTTRVDARLRSEAIEGEEIVVRAERPMVQKDLTSSSVTVSSEELQRIPTENLAQVVNLQAGVVGGHFRGGRSNEVAYLIDGVAVTDPFNGQMSLQIDNSAIREMEVISGTFNAEYGQAMSGVVNVVTQEGAQSYHGSASAYSGDYVTSHTSLFPNVGKLANFRIQNVQGSISGPIVDNLTFLAMGRYYHDDGHLWGKRVHSVTDASPYILRDGQGSQVTDPNGNPIYIFTQTGDGKYVAMNPGTRRSLNGRLTYTMPELKLSYGVFWEDNWNKYYSHAYAWTPDGIMNHYRTNWVHSLQISHTPSANTYQTLKFAYNWFDYKGYLYEDAFDARYVDPSRGEPISGYSFRSGGNQADRYDRYSKTLISQWNLNSQVSSKHKIGIGIEARLHDIYNHGTSLINLNTTIADSTGAYVFVMGYPDLGTDRNQAHRKRPIELSAFLQDKMEYELMIVNAGVRFDYFDPRSSYPLDLRNPTRNPNFNPTEAGVLKKAGKKIQVSPRLGVSFPITDEGILHFSYGHFFQIPSFEFLYRNSDYIVTESSGLTNITGNPDLDAQRTIMYELGLQQVLFKNISVDATVYYRDIRNLLGMEIINTYEGIKYARFINRDYAKVKGFIFSIDRRFTDFFGVKLDYTYQLAEGNASDPYSVYYNNQTDPPIETNKKVVPLDWDQQSTLNLSLTFGRPGDWNVGAICQLGSGFPYTEDVRVANGVRFENGGRRPSTFTVDLRAEKTFEFDGIHFSAFALVYNLFDTKNEVNVDASSGRANVDLYTYLAGPRVSLNTIDQYLNNPTSFSAPRQLQIGVTAGF